MDTLHIDTIKQKVANYITKNKSSGPWTIGPNHHPDHDNVIYLDCSLNPDWHPGMHFRLGGLREKINDILDRCYRSDIEMFAADEGIIDVEEIA
tara:strand:- start:304 stop:585 length:282 start_codon:yes stop_codon:yes gene_type:complete